MIRQILYKWFNVEEERCQSCEVLKQLVASQQEQIRELIQGIIPKQKEEYKDAQMKFESINPLAVPFRLKRAQLERESLLRAEKIQANKSVESLEKEVLENPSV